MSAHSGAERFARMFAALAARNELAFVPFAVLGDPAPGDDRAVLDALIEGGADALELGIPFSDPIADGPVIQRAANRARDAGATPDRALETIAGVRRDHPELPIGLLIYANLLEARGLDESYRRFAEAGVDAVLVADVPLGEFAPYAEAARAAGVAPVALVPLDADLEVIERAAAASEEYVYVLARRGVTGDADPSSADARPAIESLAAHGAPPALLGFGISTPEQVRNARAFGAAGAIAGSAVVRRLETAIAEGREPAPELREYVAAMKAATRPTSVV